MTHFDWTNEIIQWSNKKRKVKPYQEDLIEFFQKAFGHTAKPDEAYFGTSSSGISLVVGGIYLAALAEGRIIYLLLDKAIKNIPNTETHITKSTSDFDSPLYWFYTKDLSQLNTIVKNQEIWESFYKASYRIFENKRISAYRNHIAKNKVVLSAFWNADDVISEIHSADQLEHEFQEEVRKAEKLSTQERRKKLQTSNPKPRQIITRQINFIRNPYVVAEVLERAGGFCENCLKPAPFLKDKDQKPYLEVHHKKPLSEDGDDTVDNAVALCPNCHRHAHYGKNSYRPSPSSTGTR